MVLATVNKPKRLLYLTFVGAVKVDELLRGHQDLVALLGDLEPGFRLLTDLSRLDSIDINCFEEIGRVMELCDKKGVGLVVRVIPDPAKDIGLNILSLFHYHRPHQSATCKDMAEAARLLSF